MAEVIRDFIKIIGSINGYGIMGVLLWGYFLGYALFPNSAFYRVLLKIMDKLMCGGARQRL